MAIPIKNANTIPLSQNVGTLPNMSGTIQGWFLRMTFVQIVKSVVNFQNVETPTVIDFQGVWQVMSPQTLQMKPEGQRKWKWFTVHAQIGVPLEPDDVITYQGTQYRIRDKIDYKEYGYEEYHLIQDYTGSGPE